MQEIYQQNTEIGSPPGATLEKLLEGAEMSKLVRNLLLCLGLWESTDNCGLQSFTSALWRCTKTAPPPEISMAD
jgi:hypothetical protein